MHPSNITFNIARSMDFFKKLTLKESFSDSDDEAEIDFIKNNYCTALKARAKAVTEYLLQSPQFSPWRSHWEFLSDNLFKKNKLNFKLLKENDSDIAYVMNKGSEVNFRFRDKERFVPLNIYQYVLYHEMAHMSTHELQHTEEFHQMLNLISLAAYELGFIDLKRIPAHIYYKTNGQPITSAESLQDEIILGCNEVIKTSMKYRKVYEELREHVAKRI